MELYKTIKKEAHVAQNIKRSRFIAHAGPVETRREADEFIASVKKKYRDATHNVPAMVIGDRFQIQWASDDGEPQGTSGAPIVQMLVKEGITDIVIVVTRYFGGVKLGTGGLVRAYTGSAGLAVESAGICVVEEVCRIEAEIDYACLAEFQKMRGRAFDIVDVRYGEKAAITVQGRAEDERALRDSIDDLTSGRAEVKKIERIHVKKSLDSDG